MNFPTQIQQSLFHNPHLLAELEIQTNRGITPLIRSAQVSIPHPWKQANRNWLGGQLTKPAISLIEDKAIRRHRRKKPNTPSISINIPMPISMRPDSRERYLNPILPTGVGCGKLVE